MDFKKLAITIFSLGIGIGGFTLFSFNHTTINPPPYVDPNQNDNEKYSQGITAMGTEEYEKAINYFISIDSNYKDIENVQQSLSTVLISYTYSIKDEVNKLVTNSTANSTNYTNAINIIDEGLDYLNSLEKNNIPTNKNLENQRSYVKLLIKIYDYRKNGGPFKALNMLNKNNKFFDSNNISLTDLKNDIINECKTIIKTKINDYNSNKEYVSIIDYINNLDEVFLQDFNSNKNNAERNLFTKINIEVRNYIGNDQYNDAKKCVDSAYSYLKQNNDFIKLYNQWHNYSDSNFYYKKITDDNSVKRGEAKDIDNKVYNDVIIISKYNSSDTLVEFSLDKNYSYIKGTLFLTDYNYRATKESPMINVQLTDDQGNTLAEYKDLSYKNPINFNAIISGHKYIRFIISGENGSVKVGIRNATLS